MTIAAFAFASAAFAQTEAKDSVWAAKEAAKAKKVQDAADLKAFKEKQKADLAAFIEAQKKGTPNDEFKYEKPVLTTADDSTIYLYGVNQSNGLKQYAANQFNVEEAQLGKFAQGILDRVNIDPEDKELNAYLSGQQIGSQLISMTEQFSKDYYSADPDMSADAKLVASGLVAGLMGLSDIEPEKASEQFRQIMTARQAANSEKLYGPNREAGEKFLAENKTKEGVVTTASGLQYKVIEKGNGAIPTAKDKVKVDYEGRLIDGTVFDSSYKRGQAASFGVTQVIKGWTEALQLMPVGSKWELYIPYQLAYGERATGKDIKPYSALIFTVELKDIEK